MRYTVTVLFDVEAESKEHASAIVFDSVEYTPENDGVIGFDIDSHIESA